MDAAFHRLAILQIGVDQRAAVIAPDGKAEIGALAVQRIFQVAEALLVQVGQRSLPGLILEQSGQFFHLHHAVAHVLGAGVAGVVAYAGPQGVPLGEDKQGGPEAPNAGAQGQKEGDRLHRQPGPQFFHGVSPSF